MLTDRQYRNRRVRGEERAKITGLKVFGIPIKWITPYQARIDGALDLYPTSRRYHNLKTGERGTYDVAFLSSLKKYLSDGGSAQ